jgi:phosphoglycerate dehydrogenase-like enzyme
MMPPLDEMKRDWAIRMTETLPEYRVVLPETDEDAKREIIDADAAYGWVPPDTLKVARKLRWLQNPDAGPFIGYYYEELVEHPVTICNPRGIYFDHISHHIMMFLLALARGLLTMLMSNVKHFGILTRARASTLTLPMRLCSSLVSVALATRRQGFVLNLA